MILDFEFTSKQITAWKYLEDKQTEEILFGGGISGGKSTLGCFWIVLNCIRYKGSRYLLGRAVLKTLKESTVKTLFDVIKLFGLTKDVHYKYNSIEGIIKFCNGSEIVFKDLFAYPSDPEFDSLGSTEYTGAFIDEGSQVSSKAREVLLTRLRYKIDEFNIIGKLLICSNPCKNWLYYDFYKPFKENKLTKKRVFIQALASDNLFNSEEYLKSLKNRDKNTKERLLYGNWEYDDDPSKLMEYDAIVDLFTNNFVKSGNKYLSADLAMQGRDKFIIMVWNGLRGKVVLEKTKSTGKEIEEDIKRIATEYSIPRSHIIADSDGMGNYLESYINDIKTFRGNATPTDNSYLNNRSECYFKLAELVNKREIYLEGTDEIISELEQIKAILDDGKKRIIKKSIIKEKLGRSCDYADVIMMRMEFELKKGGALIGDIWCE